MTSQRRSESDTAVGGPVWFISCSEQAEALLRSLPDGSVGPAGLFLKRSLSLPLIVATPTESQLLLQPIDGGRKTRPPSSVQMPLISAVTNDSEDAGSG